MTTRPTPASSAARGVRPAALPAAATRWLEIDLGALDANVATFRRRLGPKTALAAVVKADAYGHGAGIVIPRVLAAGADALAVIDVEEGVAARALAGPGVPILVLGHVPARAFPEALAADLQLTLADVAEIEPLSAAARACGATARVHVKLETGTWRRGLPPEAALEACRRIAADPHLVLEGVSTHFADIEDTTEHDYARAQIEAFQSFDRMLTRAGLAPRRRHAACSAAAILFPETHLDLARIGIGLYGLWPSSETRVSARERRLDAITLEPVMRWCAEVVEVKTAPAGAFVGYGRTWRAGRPTTIGVLPVGYHDGYDRGLSGRAHVLVRGRRAPVIGRICMNMTMVDLTDVEGAAAGDVAVLLGRMGDEQITAADLARRADTIHYEIVSRIPPHLPRVPIG